jgi:hypothetical protein
LGEQATADSDPKQVIESFLRTTGGEPAPALAVAAILALDVGDRPLHDRCRRAILEKHTANCVMWPLTSFLLDRYHRYWLYRAPYVGGWSFGRRQSYFMSMGKSEEARRAVEAGLQTLDGSPFGIPKDSSGNWTVLLFTAN